MEQVPHLAVHRQLVELAGVVGPLSHRLDSHVVVIVVVIVVLVIVVVIVAAAGMKGNLLVADDGRQRWHLV